MADTTQLPAGMEQPEENGPAKNEAGFESDTQKVVRQHLEDKDHVITEEDIANIRVGMTQPMDEPTAARFEGDTAIENVENNIVGDQDDMDKSKNDRDNRLTAWDTIDPA